MHQTIFVQSMCVCSNGDTFQLPPAPVESGGRYTVNQVMRGNKNESQVMCKDSICPSKGVYSPQREG